MPSLSVYLRSTLCGFLVFFFFNRKKWSWGDGSGDMSTCYKKGKDMNLNP